jgi:hypothetical protein
MQVVAPQSFPMLIVQQKDSAVQAESRPPGLPQLMTLAVSP